jgi:hypothetical protein
MLRDINDIYRQKTCKSESSFERQTFVCEIKDTKNWNNTENDKTAIIKNH